jgi:hypothetical protein
LDIVPVSAHIHKMAGIKLTGSLPAHEVLLQGRTPALKGGEASQKLA